MKTLTKPMVIAALIAMLDFVRAQADQLGPATICAGAVTLNNGSIVTIGQPSAGLIVAARDSVQVQVGIIPILTAGVPVSGPPQIEPARSLVNGRFQMTFATQPGINYVVQASTNLINWDAVWTNAAAGGSLLFEDAQTTNFSRRFYRVMSQ